MTKLQKYLNETPDWVDKLRQPPYNLLIHGRDNLILFKYVQFASDFSLDLVKECRGIILERNTWEVVCRPFDKFFNFGEKEAFLIKFSNSYVMEKVDGSLIKLYFYDKEWRVATNGTIDASDAATSGDENVTFKDLFFDVMSEKKFKKFTSKLNTNFTYLFELIHPLSRVIVNYGDKKELVLVGIRTNSGGDLDIFHPMIQEIIREQLFGFSEIRFPKVYKIGNIKDISELSTIADEMNVDGTDFEGFVVAEVRDGSVLGRVKIKSPKYLKFHRLTGGQGVRNNIVQLLIDGEQSEFEAYLQQLPDYIKTEYVELKEKYDKFVVRLNDLATQYKEFAVNKDRKTIALDIQNNVERHLQSFVFAHLFKNVSVIEYIQDLGSKKIKDML